MLLTRLLDVIHADTKVVLYLDGEKIGSCRVYEFPDKHDLNEYYGHTVVEVKPVCLLELEVYLKEK